MFIIGLIKNLMICEKKLSPMLDSSKKMTVLLAFSCFPTYTDSLLLPGFPLLEVLCTGNMYVREGYIEKVKLQYSILKND